MDRLHNYTFIFTFLQYMLQCYQVFSIADTIHEYDGVIQHSQVNMLIALVTLYVFKIQLTNFFHLSYEFMSPGSISSNFQVQQFQAIIILGIVAPYMPAIAVYFSVSHFTLCVFIYIKLSQFLENCEAKAKMNNQIAQGKKFLKLVLPQTTIDALLMNVVEKGDVSGISLINSD